MTNGTPQGIKPDTIQRRRALYHDARRILALRLAQEVRLREVARAMPTSSRQLQRSFAQEGTTFHGELLKLRVERARELLAGTDDPVAWIARRVGYRQPAQFAKAFRRVTGQSPTEFRTARSAPALDRAA